MALMQRSILAAGMAAALLGQSALAARAVQAATPEAVVAADYAACQVQTEAEFRAAIAVVTLRAMEKGLANLDYHALIADQWRKGGIDQIIDKQVDGAIDQVRGEESWTELVRSLGSKA